MGQPAIDLPDPLQAAADSADSAQSADDLLAQLAGDEIDRLLADADEDAEPVAEATTAAAAAEAALPEADASTDAASDAIAAAEQRLDAVDGPAADDPPVPSAQPERSLPVAAEPAAAPASAAAALAEELDASGPPAVPFSSRAEPAADEPASVPSLLDEVLGESDEPDLEPPLLVRPLYWLNKPFEHLSDGARSLLGKIAIVTLLNAALVIAYVMFLRR